MVRTLIVLLLLSTAISAKAQAWREAYEKASVAFADGQFSEAIDLGEQAHSLFISSEGINDGNHAAICRLLATSNFQVDQYDKSIDWSEKELAIWAELDQKTSENYATASFNLGNAQLLMAEYDQAAQALSEALKAYRSLQAPKMTVILTEWKLGSALYYNGRDEEAKKYFESAFQKLTDDDPIDFDYVQAAYDYSALLIAEKRWSEADSYLEQLQYIFEDNELKEDPSYPEVIKRRSVVAFAEGKMAEGDALYDKALEGFTNLYVNDEALLIDILNLWAVELKELGLSDKASDLLANSTDSSASSAAALSNLGSIEFENQSYSKASNYFAEALTVLESEDKKETIQYAQIAENLSATLQTTGATTEALKYQEIARDIFSKLGETDRLQAANIRLSSLLLVNNEEEKAEEILNQTLNDVSIKAENRLKAELALAVLYHKVGNYSKAESLYKSNISEAEKLGGNLYASLLNNYGSFEEDQGNFLSARQMLLKALAEEESLYGKNSLPYAATCENLAMLFLEIGETENALSYIESAAEIRKSVVGENNRLYASTLLNEARIYLAAGDYKKAEPAYFSAVELVKSLSSKEDPLYAEAINSLAVFYQTLGNFEEARPLFEQSVEIFGNSFGKKNLQYATSLENLASLFQLTGQPDKALQLLEEVLIIDRELLGEQHPLYSTTLHNLASIYKEQNNFTRSVDLFKKALEIDKNVYGREHPSYARTLFNLASVYQDQENYEKAREIYEEVLELRKKLLGENHPDYALSLYGLASIYRVLEKPEAETYYTQAIEKYLFQIRENFPAMSEKEKSAFYEKIRPVFESFKDFSFEQAAAGNTEILQLLYDLQLSTKALLLNASSKVRERILASGDKELIDTFTEWLQLKERLVKYYTMTVEELQAAKISIDELQEEANRLEKEISLNSELFASALDKEKTNWKQVASKLSESDLAIELFRVERTYVKDSIYYAGLLIDKNMSTPKWVVFPRGNSLEERYYKYYRNAIQYSVGDTISYREFWSPMEKITDDYDKIYISSDGIFNKLNYNTLYDSRRDSYVLDEHEIRFVSNTVELLAEKSSSQAEKRAFVLGDPAFGGKQGSASEHRTGIYGFNNGVPDLPGTALEVEFLKNELQSSNWNLSLYTRQKATEENFKMLNSPRLLHIATHGFFMPDLSLAEDGKAFGIHLQDESSNPLFRSGIMLAGVNEEGGNTQEDGVLSAYEAMNLNLDQTELVVLSACETGLGEVRNGEGVYGLQRSFIVAGAESLMMSLWKVNDETTQKLMALFYEKWLSGTDKFQAFKEAQLELKEIYPDPFHWGAFVILGQ